MQWVFIIDKAVKTEGAEGQLPPPPFFDRSINPISILNRGTEYVHHVITKGQLISKCLLGVIVWTKIATKKFDNFCPGGQIKKIKTLYYTKYPIINIKKCL